jgi:hypothetical protein
LDINNLKLVCCLWQEVGVLQIGNRNSVGGPYKGVWALKQEKKSATDSERDTELCCLDYSYSTRSIFITYLFLDSLCSSSVWFLSVALILCVLFCFHFREWHSTYSSETEQLFDISSTSFSISSLSASSNDSISKIFLYCVFLTLTSNILAL